MQIIPAIDIIDGKCVRLTQGDYSQKTIYNENPLEVALEFESVGIKRLHLVDLDGAKLGKVVNYKVLEKIANKTKLSIDFGGGIKTAEDIETVFNYGADIATIGSIAVKNKELFFSWIKKYGTEKIFLGADVKDEKIIIANSGEPIENYLLEDIFKPFYSRKPKGRGIGLYVSRTSLRDHGLDLIATNDPNYNTLEGACFIIQPYTKSGNDE